MTNVFIPLPESGSLIVPETEYKSKVSELGSETAATRYFLKEHYKSNSHC